MKKLLEEFKKFAVKGNALDLAVGIMLGTAFNQIVQSLVNDVIMPPLGLIIGGIKFNEFKFFLKEPVTDATGKTISDGVSINYGNFIQVFVNFLIIAFSLFLAIKVINIMKERAEKKEKKQKEEKAEESKEVQLLTQIKNILEKQSKK